MWCRADSALDIAHAHARDDGFDAIAADCLVIADDGSLDFIPKTTEDGEVSFGVDRDHISRSKLRVETRLKLLAKWDPKRYGERLELEHNGSINQMPAEQLDARITALLAKTQEAADGDAGDER